MYDTCVCVLVAQLCLTLCEFMDCRLPGSSVHGILQAKILEWTFMTFYRGSSWPRDQTLAFLFVGRFFTIWATQEALDICVHLCYLNVLLKISLKSFSSNKS